MSILLTGCDVDPSVAPSISTPDALFWTLRIDYPAVRLTTDAPYNTVQLTAIPYSAVNAVIDTSRVDYSTTTWSSTDSTLVRVTSDGLVRARGVTGNKKIYVVARKQVNGVTREDRALIQVVDLADPPVLASFRSRPADSLKRAAGTVFTMIPRLLDRDSVPLTGYPVHYRASNPIVTPINAPWGCTVSAGNLLGTNVTGTSHIIASTMVFGVALVDTFTLEVGYPIAPLLGPVVDVASKDGVPVPHIKAQTVNIGPGGVVSFRNDTGINGAKATKDPGLTVSNGTIINIIFDDSLNVKDAGTGYTPTADGNMYSILSDTLAPIQNRRHYRKFPTPGRFEYTVEPYGLRGVVVVHDR